MPPDPALVGHLAIRYRIEEAAALLQDYPFVANSQMMGMLDSIGFEHEQSVSLVAFVPMAYLRALLAREGTYFPATCIFYNHKGEEWLVALDKQPIFEAAASYARYDIARGMLQEHIQGIILRSCEFAQINTLLAGGILADELALEPGEFNVDGEDLALEPEPEMDQPSSAWWKFW